MPRARRRSSSTRSRSGIRCTALADAGSGFGFTKPPNELLCLAHGEVLADHGIEHAILDFGRQTAERSPMPLGQPAFCDRRLRRRRQVEQSKRVRHRRARATDPGREIVLGEAELLDELSVCVCGLDRVEVVSLEVLDEREFQLFAVGELADDRRDAVEACGLAQRGGAARRRRAGSRRWSRSRGSAG